MITFAIWHILAISSLIVVSFISGYYVAMKRKEKIERSIHMMQVRKTELNYEN
jgi:hypothetical protein